MKTRKEHQTANSVRIIGGSWRSRRIDFRPDVGIRPTPDRIRETLFNWLQKKITGASCLELYAGSGVLSMEALSRGARHVTIIDQSAAVISRIKANLQKLGSPTSNYDCIQYDAGNWIRHQADTRWDVIFLDPPFNSAELEMLLPLISAAQLLHPDGYLYIETPMPLTINDLPPDWQIYRNKKASKVHYCLCQRA